MSRITKTMLELENNSLKSQLAFANEQRRQQEEKINMLEDHLKLFKNSLMYHEAIPKAIATLSDALSHSIQFVKKER